MFPILDDSMVSDYEEHATEDEKEEMEQLFGVEKVINLPARSQSQQSPHEIVSVTLFWKHVGMDDPDLPPPTPETLLDAERMGLVKRFSPWEAYIEPMTMFTKPMREEHPDVELRVYLASDLEFLVPELTALGWSIHLMKSPSIRYCPGGFWRFLALEEENAMITIVDADRMKQATLEVARTRTMHQMGLGLWRVPGYYNCGVENHVRYRPILGGHFGARGGLPVRKLIEAFLWLTQRDKMDNSVQIPGIGEKPILFAQWPGYGFDEWFQLAAMYPRLVQDGTRTFIPRDSRSLLLPADLEYVMWANPKSESIYF